jgi:hypothetical protein
MLEASLAEAAAHGRRSWDRRVICETLARADEASAAGQSPAKLAEQLGVPRTTLGYWLARKAGLEGSPKVADFFESPEGLAVLHQISVAAHFVIGFTPRRGVRGVCDFLELSGLSRFVASSYGAQQQVASQMEVAAVDYGETTPSRLVPEMTPRKITLCEDETFHPAICLVGIEPVSDFIVLETYAEKRDAKTWNAAVSKALAGLPIEVVQSTSDEGKGLLAHVREGLGVHHSPDLFHLQREISKGLCPRLNADLRGAQRLHEAAVKATEAWQRAADLHEHFPETRRPGRPPNFPKHIEWAAQAEAQALQAVEHVKAQRQQVREALQGISEAYHPFDLKTGQLRPVETVEVDLQQQFAKLDQLADTIDLGERSKGRIDKARRLIPKCLSTLTFVFSTFKTAVEDLALPPPAEQVLYHHLIPGLYLCKAASKASTAEKRKAIEATARALLAPVQAPESPLAGLDPKELAHIERVATECADLFQRSSSCVEGRNGQLALWHHHLHIIRPRRLKALTVVHNYFTKHPDGRTPAQHFFGVQHEDLFAWLLDRISLPARPARKRPKPLSQPVLAFA